MTVLPLQVTHLLRPVSASDYDAAAHADPAQCPLLAAGDRRSGRQLLADAAADALQDPRTAWRTVRGARILVLDEATSSIDGRSDAVLQRRLRAIAGVTIITIAHRVNTIVDYDRILVLDAGRVLEYGEPKTLLADPASAFAALVRSSKTEG